jgi:subtilisin family serine protease
MKRRRLRGLLSAVLCGALLTAVLPLSTLAAETVENQRADDAWDEYVNNQTLVFYTDGTFEVISYDSADALKDGVTALLARDDVSSVQPNFTYQSDGSTETDPMYSEQWALSNDGSFQMASGQNRYPVYDSPFGQPSAPMQWQQPGGRAARKNTARAASVSAVSGIDINTEEAWDRYDGGDRSVIVALIDTGVDTTHEDLQGILWTNPNEIAGNGLDDDGDGYVDDVNGWNFFSDSNTIYTGTSEDDHGTHCAGTIAARSDNGVGITGILGQTDNVQIMVLKALGGSDGSGSTASIVQAIRYAEEHGASIVNLSLGTSTFDYALYSAMKNSDMLFVVAAGNDGADSSQSPSYPADYDLPNIISVANLSSNGTLEDSSNYGADTVDLAAPGTYILSTTASSSYGYMTGTSMAAPMVTAAAAMLYTYDDSLSLPQVKEILLNSAAPLSSLAGKVVTGGMLDLGTALSWDTSELTAGDDWEQEDGGTAPVLSDTVEGNYLTLTVSDAENDVAVVCYARGELTAEDFASGENGTQVSLTDDAVRFRIAKGGTYTFYAIDLAGNESVLTVTVEAQTDREQTSSDQSPTGGYADPPTGRQQMPMPGFVFHQPDWMFGF